MCVCVCVFWVLFVGLGVQWVKTKDKQKPKTRSKIMENRPPNKDKSRIPKTRKTKTTKDDQGKIYYIVRAEFFTELILKKAGPVLFKTFLVELIAFQIDSSDFCCKRSKA